MKPESKRFSLCADLTEQPVYKLVNYQARKRKLTVVFVGKQEEQVMAAINSDKRTKTQEKLLLETFGKNFVNKLGLSIKGDKLYVQERIYHDDTVQCMLSKARQFLDLDVRINQIYAWIEISAKNAQSITSYFLNTLFMDQTMIPVKTVADHFESYTGKSVSFANGEKLVSKQEAYRILSKQKYKSILEPLVFKYAKNTAFEYFPVDPFKAENFPDMGYGNKYDHVYEHARLLESFSMVGSTIHIITSKVYDSIFGNVHKSLYFPIVGALKEIPAEIITASDEIMQQYHSRSLSNIKTQECNFNYVHLRVNEFMMIDEEMISIPELFTKCKPDIQIPFIKYISAVNTEYKVYKPALTADSFDRNVKSAQISFDQLCEWTKVDLIRFVKVMHDIVVLKVHLVNNSYATIIVHGNGMYDVKINYMINEKVDFNTVTTHLKRVNTALKAVMMPKQYVAIDTSSWVKETDESDTRVVKLMTSGVITSTGKLQSIAALQASIKFIFPFVSVVSSKGGILHLLYKRIDNFSKQDNIMIFMSKNYMLPDDELLTKLVDNFGITPQEAKEQLQDWKKKNNISSKLGGKVYYKQTLNDFVSIKVKPSGIGYKYVVTGVTSALHHRRIIRALKYLVSITEAGGKAGTKQKQLDKLVDDEKATDIYDDLSDIDDLMDDDGDADADITEIADTDAIDQTEKNFQKFLEDFNTEDLSEAGVRLLEMKEQMDCPVTAAKSGGAKKTEQDKSHMFLLKPLYDADHDLFVFTSSKNYAKSCQESQKRQPVVLQEQELKYIKKCFPGAVENHVNTGSTPELAARNHYICPVVWCPKSRVAMSKQQLDEDYGGKCPFEGIDEEPMLFEDKYFIDKTNGKPKKRYARFMHPSKHPDSTESEPLHLPCCFSRPDSEEQGNEKYIKAYTYPLPRNRYGLLPASLVKLFKSKFCGGKNGTTGLMNSKTDCYLRNGVNLSKQSYLTCLVQLLENPSIKTEANLIDTIISKLKISTFVLLDKGLLCKKFINDAWNIHNAGLYARFKKWFIDQSEYIVTFSLQDVANEVNESVVYGSHLVYKNEIKREFLIYSAYIGFIKYLQNDNFPKSHDILNTLVNMQLPWLNKHGYNIVVFESESIKKREDGGKCKKQSRLKQIKHKIEQDDDDNADFASLGLENVYLTCPYSSDLQERFRREKNTLFLIKSGRFYEPIIHVVMKKNKLIETTHHKFNETPEINRVIKYYLEFCTPSKHSSALDLFNAINSSGQKVVTQVIDYDYNLIAFYTSNSLLVPLDSPENTLGDRVPSYAFVDTAIRHFKFEEKSERVFKYLEKLNSILDKKPDYFKIRKGSDSKYKIHLSNNNIDIPIGSLNKHLLDAHQDDIHIFINEQEVDKRIESNTVQKHEQNVYNAFRNEVVHILNYDSSLLSDLQFLRHPSNPISLNQKRAYLLKKLLPFMPRFAHEVSEQFYKGRITDQFQERVCSTIGKQNECMNQCIWAVDMRTKSTKKKVIGKQNQNQNQMRMVAAHCKLAIKTGDSRNLLEKVVDDLLNPTSLLKLVKENRSDQEDDDVLHFTDREIENEDLVKMLMQMENPRIYDHQYDSVPVDPQRLAEFDKNYVVKEKAEAEETGNMLELPHTWRKQLKGFQIRELEYTHDFIYQFFVKIAARVSNLSSLTSDQLKRLVYERIAANLDADYAGTRKQLMYNQSIKGNSKEELLQTISSKEYYPSEYELQLIAEIVKVNIIVLSSRVSTRHDQIRCLGKVPGADYYVMLFQPTSSKRDHDIFHVILKEKQQLFQLADFDQGAELIGNLCKMHSIKKKKLIK